MIRNRALVITNTITTVLMLLANYLSNTKTVSDVSVADISYKYNTLFAPAGYAFSIWGIIFLFCLAFVFYQWKMLGSGQDTHFIKQAGLWFSISNMANILWLYCWLNEWLGFSVLVILFLLVSLIMLTIKLRLEIFDGGLRIIFFVWWPVAIYLGWMMVASIACIAAWLVSIGAPPLILGEVPWTIVMIVIATMLYGVLIYKRNLRETAAVGVWAFIAIAVRHWYNYQSIAIAALIAAGLLLIMISAHAYRNRAFSVVEKLKAGAWK